MNHKFSVIFVLVLSIIFAACSPDQAAPQVSTPGAVSIEAASVAQQALAEQLAVALEQVKIEKVEDETWPDACLEVQEPGVTCAQEETQGYRMKFTAPGQSCEVRSNLDGSILRIQCMDES